MSLHLLHHPLADYLVTRLRDKETPPEQFRQCCRQLSLLLALEATRDLRTSQVDVTTPLERCKGIRFGQTLVVVPILRAGLGMMDPIVEFFPDVNVGYVGLERDHATAVARSYYCKLPPVKKARVLVVDPMLATGGSAVQAIQLIADAGAEDIRLLNVVAAPEGVTRVMAAFPEVAIHSAALDRELNADKYILPGLGDFGDRLYGT